MPLDAPVQSLVTAVQREAQVRSQHGQDLGRLRFSLWRRC